MTVRTDSYDWDHELGVCKRHMLPSVPCPACLADPENSELVFTSDSWDELNDWQKDLVDREKASWYSIGQDSFV